jgi:signal transduction histidine kinase
LRPGRVRRFWAEHQLIGDAVLAMVVVVLPTILFVADPRHSGRKLPDSWIIATAIAAVLVTVRRQHPPVVLGLATAAATVLMVVDEARNVVFVTVFVCLYTVATTGTRRLAIAAGVASALTLSIIAATSLPGGWLSGETLSTIAWMGMAVAAGEAVRSRHEYVTAVEERAIRAEHGREQEARRQVAEERLRIARELHDVVAHHMAMITVQSGVAAHLLRSQPDQAEQALTIVRESGRSVLKEMTGMLNVLRRPEDPADPLEPLPDLHRLGDLVDSFAAAGLHVEWRTSGAPEAMVTTVQLTVYRVIQESLTNAHKYGDGRAVLCVTYAPGVVEIDVENAVRGGASVVPEGSGLGIIGMRERVAALGGTITSGRDSSGVFRVSARVPTSNGDD